jgi:transposase-like protein
MEKKYNPNDKSLLKSLYIVAVELDKKWSMRSMLDRAEYTGNFLFYLRAGFRLG